MSLSSWLATRRAHRGATTPTVDAEAAAIAAKDAGARRSRLLVVSFLLMIVVGLGNKIFQKLQTEPMHDYPYFLSLLTTFIYIPTRYGARARARRASAAATLIVAVARRPSPSASSRDFSTNLVGRRTHARARTALRTSFR